jgi:hypothetical protein
VTARARILLVASAALTTASLALPLWGVRMTAPQYPDEPLMLRIDRHGIGGDVQEVETLQEIIGVRFPERLPELEWLPVVVLGLSSLLLAGALGGSRPVARWLRAGTVVIYLIFLAGAAAIVQARLYTAGHSRDPNAPIQAVKNFTPPLIGPTTVGNFTVWSFPHVGALALLTAAGLSAAAARARRAG